MSGERVSQAVLVARYLDMERDQMVQQRGGPLSVVATPPLPPSDDPFWTSQDAPHEAAALLRLNRAGWPGSQIIEALKMTPGAMKREFKKALDDEGEAHRKGQKLVGSTVPRGTK